MGRFVDRNLKKKRRPHISKVKGLWYCTDKPKITFFASYKTGFGRTPQLAFYDWWRNKYL